MIISKKELLDVFEDSYHTGKQAEMLNKQISEALVVFAETNKIGKKAVKAAYTAYKAFKEGKVTSQDDDYFTMQSIIEEHFAGEGDSSEDQVAG